ncbi:S8 family serine peptidase [Acanthopleuribacter pedis]|uniref:Peptidase S8/S53 domain-containing protein n=1 Tax=Acanthopleuribacter pedis TaxID=442870 RepID=A0A8J7Q5S1_9BACT|nr:S8 family serine peptidase [Acanthopleuribacter pedis]MBO1317149.1 hypothetical protein [Acanthopleuribacter pedis]
MLLCRVILLAGFWLVLGSCLSLWARFPWGDGVSRAPYAYPDTLYWAAGQPAPANYSPDRDWWLSGRRDPRPELAFSPQELYGVRGMSLPAAWRVSTGRPDVVIAVMDSGIRWAQRRYCELVRKIYLNAGELPLPADTANPADTRFGGYDANGDGVFNVVDYWEDPRVVDINGNGWVDPEDLILTFSDGRDDDQNGFTDDISGWDFFENDNNARDDVDFGHGTNQARYAAAEAFEPGESCALEAGLPNDATPGTCPNCMVLPLRVGDSFVVDVNHYAQAVVYAVDLGVAVIESALGSLNQTSYAAAADAYAYHAGVVINASAADEASDHHNWPGAYEHTLVHNSLKPPEEPGTFPESYLFLNGCTNFGGNIHVAVPSERCSSQAAGLAAGLSGLLISAAANAVERGTMTPYRDDAGRLQSYPLSPAEVRQLWRLAADDIDFATPYPDHAFSDAAPFPWSWRWFLQQRGLWENYAVVAATATERYHTGPGWDYYTGYGRINAGRLLAFIGREEGSDREPWLLHAEDRIPPEAEIKDPTWFRDFNIADGRAQAPADPSDPEMLVINGRAAANRVTAAGGRFGYVLEWAPGVQGRGRTALPAGFRGVRSPGPWHDISRVEGLTAAFRGELGRVPFREILAVLQDPAYTQVDPRYGSPYAVRLRLTVTADPANPYDRVNNQAVFQKQIFVRPAETLTVLSGLGFAGGESGGCASPVFADLDGDGGDELLVATDDGLLHALTGLQPAQNLPGWPVRTRPLSSWSAPGLPEQILGGFLFGAPAVADLDGDGMLYVLLGDQEGRLYAWDRNGRLKDGFPVGVDPNLSRETPCTAPLLPDCDDLGPVDLRNEQNQRDHAFFAAPAVGDLDPLYPGLEIVIGAADSHVYAFHADGSPVPGWPVLLRDPAKVAAVDAATRIYTIREDGDFRPGSKIITTPSLADLDNDGDLEVITLVNEQYQEFPRAAFGGSFIELLLLAAEQVGNTRVYVLEHSGSLTPPSVGALLSVHPHDQAYRDGWPVAITLAGVDLVPVAGQGGTAQVAVADLDGDGRGEIVTAGHWGPATVLNDDGSSFYGRSGLGMRTLARDGFGDNSPVRDDPSFAALGGMAVGSLDGGASLSLIAPAASVRRLLDIALVGRQLEGEDQLAVWRASTGEFEPFAPTLAGDLAFFNAPTVVDCDGDNRAEILAATSGGDLQIIGLTDAGARTIRRRVIHSGGWLMNAAAVGRLRVGEDFRAVLVTYSREGRLRVYPLPDYDPGSAVQWPRPGRDHHNSGWYR